MHASSVIRILSLGLLVVILKWLSPDDFKSVFVAMLFSHYLLAAYYAKNRLRGLARTKSTWPPVLSLAGASLFYFWSGAYIPAQAPLTVLHTSMSDVYMANDLLEGKAALGDKLLWHLNLARYLLMTACLALLFREIALPVQAPIWSLHAAVLGSALYLGAVFFSYRSSAQPKIFASYCLFESIGLACCYALYLGRVHMVIQYLVYYHILVWIVLPVYQFDGRGKGAEPWSFLSMVAVSSLFFWWIRSGLFFHLKPADLDSQIPFWASVHFISTLALSRYNPEILARFFAPKIRPIGPSPY